MRTDGVHWSLFRNNEQLLLMWCAKEWYRYDGIVCMKSQHGKPWKAKSLPGVYL